MARAYVDTDIIHKAIAFGLSQQIFSLSSLNVVEYYALGAARYMIAGKLRKRPLQRSAAEVEIDLKATFDLLGIIEPTDSEVEYAASLEATAQQYGLALHAGESLLCAVVALRLGDYLFTGDKGAAEAISQLIFRGVIDGPSLKRKLVCLEQLILLAAKEHGIGLVRERVCSERGMDRALAICFSCNQVEHTPLAWIDGLNSYISDIKRRASDVIFDELSLARSF